MNFPEIFLATLLRRSRPTASWLLLTGLLLALSSAVAEAADDGIGAQYRPNLAFAELAPTRIFHVAVTGRDGNSGTAESPWRTINYAVTRLRPGEAAYVHAGTYYERVHIGPTAADGTATAPIHLMAAPGEAKPVLRGGDGKTGAMLRLQRRYWVVSGFNIQVAGSETHGVRFEGARYSVVRDSEVANGTGPAAVVFYSGSADVGFLRNKVHHYTWGTRDSHGLLVLPDTARILIQGNESWANGGDSFQCQGTDSASGAAHPVDITLEGNRFHEDRENAVDIKTCDRVTLRGNKFYGYRPSSTSPQGDAVIVHLSARRILVEGNRIWNNGRGMAVGGTLLIRSEPVADVIIRRNVVFDGTTANGGKGMAMYVGTSRRVRIHHNTVVNMPVSGIRLGDGSYGPSENTEIYNNIISATPSALDINFSDAVGFRSDRNLAYRAGTETVFRANGRMTTLAGWRSTTGHDKSSRVGDPLFVSDPYSNDFYTLPGSPARDAAMSLTPLAPLLSGTLCGAGADLGFLESCL